MVSTLLLSSFLVGCAEKEETYIYVYRDCPNLQTYDVKTRTYKPLEIHYTIKNKEDSNTTLGKAKLGEAE